MPNANDNAARVGFAWTGNLFVCDFVVTQHEPGVKMMANMLWLDIRVFMIETMRAVNHHHIDGGVVFFISFSVVVDIFESSVSATV